MQMVYIKSALSTPTNNLYLDVYKHKAEKGSYCIVDNYHGGMTQKWIIDTQTRYIRSAVNPSLILDIKGVTGTYLILWQPNGGENQQWKINGNFIVSLLKSQPPKVVDVMGEKNIPGTYVCAWPKHPKEQNNQMWSFVSLDQVQRTDVDAMFVTNQPKTKQVVGAHFSVPPDQLTSDSLVNNPLVVCKKCLGKKGLGSFGACEPSTVHYKMPCPCCDGAGKSKRVTECPNCNSKGGATLQGIACDLTSIHCKSKCQVCNGKCFL